MNRQDPQFHGAYSLVIEAENKQVNKVRNDQCHEANRTGCQGRLWLAYSKDIHGWGGNSLRK